MALLPALALAAPAPEPPFRFQDSQAFLKKYCLACHMGDKPAAGFLLSRIAAEQSLNDTPRLWNRVLARVRDQEMPPRNAPAPPPALRDRFTSWIDHTLRTAACADGITPARAPVRRLNRTEYAATVRDLLNIHINAAQSLPADGAGGEGFDNAAETLFISPVHAEKYLDAARAALEYAATDTRARARFMPHEPSSDLAPDAAARRNLEAFLPRAFRRPAAPGEADRYLALFRTFSKRGETFDAAMLYAFQAVLVSPHFLFRVEEPNPAPSPRPVPDYALASRLSYFLWSSMPDNEVFDLAAKGRLSGPEVLAQQIARMLKDVKAREFAESFVEQWLGTRELGRDIKPDPKLFPAYYDAELQAAFRYEPVLFFQELLANDLSLLNLIDSNFTFLTNKLTRHYGITLEKRPGQQPLRTELPPGTHRGGILGMAAVLASTSVPTRTSPVLRGKWVLDNLLGTPAPPPPPNVPPLEEAHAASAKTMRERLLQHRQNPVCASCHNKIDPLGFALENYDVLGRWRTEDAGQPIDAKAELPDGTTFEGAEGLKRILMERRTLFFRNLTAKMLGYALGRSLTLEDHCAVDQILTRLEQNNYSAQTLIREIVLSVPFRMQPAAAPAHQERKRS